MKRYPLQLRFLVPVKAEAGWKTKTQKACCSSSRYTETVQEFCHLSEQRQCHSTDTFVHELVRTLANPAAHTHIPDTSMYLYRFHPHKRSFPAVYLWSLPDMPLPFADPAPDSWSSFFPCDLMPPQCVSNAAFAASKCLSHLIGMRLGGPQHMPSVFLDRSFGNFYADFSFPNSPFLSAAFPIFVSSIWKPWRLGGSLPSYVLPVGILLCVPYIFLNSSCSYSTRCHTFFQLFLLY